MSRIPQHRKSTDRKDAPSAPRLHRVLRPSGFRPPLSWVVHYGSFPGWETVLDVNPGSLRYRRTRPGASAGAWRRRRLDLSRPHAAALLPDGAAIIADTDNDRLVILPRLDRGAPRIRQTIGGVRLRRPHHVLYNPHDRHLYVIDQQALFRLPTACSRGEAWKIPASRLGYARSLSILDGRIHVVASSRGAVLRIDDFGQERMTAFLSHGKRRSAPAGTWRDTGFVLNDVTQVGGWYYGSNYFTPDHARRGDARPLRLVRWRTWSDFRHGRWQDLSAELPAGLIPYFFTRAGSSLYLSMFCHDDHCRDGIFRLARTRHP